jgi:hypothetical protein
MKYLARHLHVAGLVHGVTIRIQVPHAQVAAPSESVRKNMCTFVTMDKWMPSVPGGLDAFSRLAFGFESDQCRGTALLSRKRREGKRKDCEVGGEGGAVRGLCQVAVLR